MGEPHFQSPKVLLGIVGWIPNLVPKHQGRYSTGNCFRHRGRRAREVVGMGRKHQTEVSLEHHNHPQRASSHCPQPQAFSGTGQSASTPIGLREAPLSTGFGQLSPKLLGKDWLLPECGDVALKTDKWGSDPDAITV